MANERTLHFTLGPVQGFISQARRTRDLWAGSFLLSYLAGHAMCAVIEDGGEIVFPTVKNQDNSEDPLFMAVGKFREREKMEHGPQVGTLPNQFKARIIPGFDPANCVRAVQEAWEDIARAVWDEFVAPVADKGNGTDIIWQRQVDSFWDIAWAVGEEDSCLDRRKNWRSHVPPVEHGDKCTLAGNLQEISGFVRAKNKEEQEQFWRELGVNARSLDFIDGERLCAVALIKRLFPLVADKAIGWPVRTKYPSTSYIAALPWLLEIMAGKPEQAAEFLLRARQGDLRERTFAERHTCISKVELAKKEHQQIAGLAECDGNFFYQSTLANKNLWPEETQEQRKNLAGILNDFNSEPSTFYAVLAMDGDRLGALLKSAGNEVVSSALARFAPKVEQAVQECGGVLIYAGGDDVLALVPAPDAVRLAAELRRVYQLAFEKTGVPDYIATISAGLVYAHHHAPLKAVLQEIHKLLEDVAKDKTGRDSLAVRVWHTGGPGLLWAVPWEKLIEEDSNLLDRLVGEFSGGVSEEKHYNSTFFYNLQRRFFQLLGAELKSLNLTEQDLVDIFLAEYLRSRGREKMNREKARQRMERLLKICCLYRRVSPVNGGKPTVDKHGISIEGALLVRFLAVRG